MKIRVRVLGARDLRRELLEAPRRVRTEVVAAYARAAARLAEDARLHAPARTGRLSASIAWEVGMRGALVAARYGAGVPYAGYTEFGTARFPVGTPLSPRDAWPAKLRRGTRLDTAPWLRPALYRHLSAILEDLRAAVLRAMPRRA